MNYGEVRAQFQGTLNRRDITPSQVEMYLKQGIQRAQRLLRVPASENTYIINVGKSFRSLPIPGDYLKMSSLVHEGPCGITELALVDMNKALSMGRHTGTPLGYCRQNAEWIIGPRPVLGSTLVLT